MALKIEMPDLGPVIGETSADRVRIWIRADYKRPDRLERLWNRIRGVEQKPFGGRKVHGALEVKSPDGTSVTTVFKMLRMWDYTGVGIVCGLQPDTDYEYRAGYFLSDADSGDFQGAVPHLNWGAIPFMTVRSGSTDAQASRSYFLGSCRYNLPWADDEEEEAGDVRGDKTFRAMLNEMDQRPAQGMILLGDQIYADVLGVGIEERESFFRLYRSAYRQPYMREVMKRLPSYMTLDDHEVEDNWPEDRSKGDYQKLNAAKYAYQAYQAGHSPLLGIKETASGGHQLREAHLRGMPEKWWYSFTDGCCDVFMMDTRLERDLEAGEIINRDQMVAVKDWLSDGSGRVKVIGSAVPFFPDGGKDKWSGFVAQRSEILDHIFDERIRKVAFLSGDVHFSAFYALTAPEDRDFKVLQVVSSPLFWPFPHIAKLEDEVESPNRSYQLQKLVKEVRRENFVRVDFQPEGVRFRAILREDGVEGEEERNAQFLW